MGYLTSRERKNWSPIYSGSSSNLMPMFAPLFLFVRYHFPALAFIYNFFPPLPPGYRSSGHRGHGAPGQRASGRVRHSYRALPLKWPSRRISPLRHLRHTEWPRFAYMTGPFHASVSARLNRSIISQLDYDEAQAQAGKPRIGTTMWNEAVARKQPLESAPSSLRLCNGPFVV